MKAFFVRFFVFFTGKIRFSRACFLVFFTFFTCVIVFHGQIFDFLHAQKNFFTPKKMKIFTGNIFVSRALFSHKKRPRNSRVKINVRIAASLEAGLTGLCLEHETLRKNGLATPGKKRSAKRNEKKKAALQLGKKDWREAPGAREAGLTVGLLRVKARKTPR